MNLWTGLSVPYICTEIRRKDTLAFYHEVPAILQDLKDRNIHVAAASRTSAKEL